MSAPSPAPAPATPKKKSRRIYRILRVGLPLLVVVILLAPWVVAKTGLRDRFINRVIRTPNVTATSQSGSFGWFSPPSVQGMELTSEQRHVRIQVNEITAERPWWRLAGSLPELGTITLDKPRIEIELPLGPRPERPERQIPTFTGVVRNGGLTVRVPGLDEPAIDLEDIDLTFRVVDADGGRVLVVDPVTLFEHRKLSPKLCDKMLDLIAPTLGDTQEVSGEVSFALDKFRVPLGLPKDQVAWQVEMEGTLTLHNVTTQTTGPLLRAIVKVVSDMYGKQPTDVVRGVKDATIRFRVADGRMHHEGLKVGFPDISPDLQVTSRGSVGLDKTLDLHL